MKKRKNSSKPISKKCSILDLAIPLALIASAGLTSGSVIASPAPVTLKQTQKPKLTVALLERDLKTYAKQRDENFEPLIEAWSKQFGTALPATLKELAENEKSEDRSRYVALMALVRYDGKNSADTAKKMLKAKSWMPRSAALKAIEILKDASMEAEVVKTLQDDPALVIRAQAVDTLVALNTKDTPAHLLSAVYDKKNYRKGDYKTGVADWVPQRALAGLRTLNTRDSRLAKTYSIKLLPIINDAKDAKQIGRAHV